MRYNRSTSAKDLLKMKAEGGQEIYLKTWSCDKNGEQPLRRQTTSVKAAYLAIDSLHAVNFVFPGPAGLDGGLVLGLRGVELCGWQKKKLST